MLVKYADIPVLEKVEFQAPELNDFFARCVPDRYVPEIRQSSTGAKRREFSILDDNVNISPAVIFVMRSFDHFVCESICSLDCFFQLFFQFLDVHWVSHFASYRAPPQASLHAIK